MVIGAGYEHRLIEAVAEAKSHAHVRLLYAFPSLQPDMYQESAIATHLAEESIGRDASLRGYFAPAYDPFATAETLVSLVRELERNLGNVSNLYLAPISTKPVAVGFALFFLLERRETATSIVLPTTRSYARRSAEGLSRVWQYRIELL